MNDTNQTSAEQAIQDQLRRLKWMIPDAMPAWTRRLNACFVALKVRSKTPRHCWPTNHAACPVDFAAEGDLRAAREAKAELAKLLEQQKMLEFFLRKD